MDFSCPQGCTVSIGMSELHSRAGETCEDHGLRLTYGKSLKRGPSKTPTGTQRVGKRGNGFATEKAQRDKVRLLPCAFCGREAVEGVIVIDPAHLWPRGRGGCGDPLCVVPACRDQIGNGCHKLLDEEKLDAFPPLLARGYRAEIAHAFVEHEPPISHWLKRFTGVEWKPASELENPEQEVEAVA